MNTYFKIILKRVLFLLLLSFLTSIYFSCQKADPNPYSNPPLATTQTITTTYTTTTPPDTNPSFKANVNSSGIQNYTPGKNVVGVNTSLTGTSTYYTIIITFPTLSTGPGNYNIGFPSTTITATLFNGVTTYYCNYKWGVGGTIKIDSISSIGKYYGTFNFAAEDTVTFNVLDVRSGSFYHL